MTQLPLPNTHTCIISSSFVIYVLKLIYSFEEFRHNNLALNNELPRIFSIFILLPVLL